MRITSVLTFALLFGPTVSIGSAQSAKAPIALKPLVVIAGADSHVHKPLYQRITNSDVWHRVWARHLGTSVDDAYRSTLEVDFDRCLLIAVLCGDKVNVRGMQVHSILDGADSLTIQIEELYYQTAGESNDKLPDRPYAFIAIPKTSKNVILQHGIRPKGADQIKWQELARLDGNRPTGLTPQHQSQEKR